MSLRLICGRAGTGKSQFCFEEIVKKRDSKEKIYMITPEQYSYTAEKKLLEQMPQGASIHAEVLTFERMAYRVKAQVGGTMHVNLSASGKSMLIQHILSEQKRNLHFLGKSEQNIEVVEKQMTEFKKHGITITMLEQTLETIQDPYLQTKLKDMLLLYKKIEEKIQNRYIDENDTLTILREQLEATDMFQDACFYIDEFVGFTEQEYRIIEKLMQVAKEVSITICTDDLDLYKAQDSDVFHSNKKTADKLLAIAKKQGTALEKTIFLKENHRFQTKELQHLEQNIYTVPYQIAKELEVKHISLFLAMNAYSEMEHIAKQIMYLVKEKQYRYKDIAVITKNLEGYSHLCKVLFAKYDIPVFMDEKKELSQNILAQYVLSILEIFAKNFSYESMFAYIKTGFLDLEEEEIYTLENFCIKWGIKGNKWYQGEWDFEEVTEKNKEKIEQIKRTRNIVIKPLVALKEKMNAQKTVEGMTKELYQFLIENRIDTQLQEKGNQLEEAGKLELAKEQKMTWDIIMDVLDEMVMIFGEERMTFEKYSELLKTGLKNSSLGKIPEVMDEVMIGDVDRTKSHKVKAVFMIGMNDGVFPTVYKEEGFFNDKDREVLKQEGVELAKGTLDRLYEDSFSIYKAFSVAEERIYLSYPSTDLEGGALRPSMLITRIKKIFPKLKEESDILERKTEVTNYQSTFEDLIYELGRVEKEEKIDPIWWQVYQTLKEKPEWKEKLEAAEKAITKTNIPEPITKENTQKLYGDTLNTSVSRLEQYSACPFSYFLQYGLKLSDKSGFKVEAVDTGTFMHEVIDSFFEKARENHIDIKQIDESSMRAWIEEIVEEKLAMPKNYIFRSNQKYTIAVQRLKRVILTSMQYILKSLQYSDFTVYGNEIEFKEEKEYPPITLTLKNGKKVEITGKIDRIDIAKVKDDNYIRIIDYKSSVKNIDLNEVMAGIQIQLLTYLDATCKQENMLPAATLYFSLLDPMLSVDSRMEQEEIEKELAKRFRMQGFILADVDIVKKMDKTLEKGASTMIPAYIDKEGNLSAGRSNAVTKEQFAILQNYTNSLIKQIAEEIYHGNIALEPCYNSKNKKTPCTYCAYSTICQFKAGEKGCQYRYIPNKEKQEILKQMEAMQETKG